MPWHTHYGVTSRMVPKSTFFAVGLTYFFMQFTSP
ncbi:hypothetical protein IW248_000741 [Micromonospora ureilytica]|uniref:Uncharacterized protein n=1 Tax=Micromonospora ureilytica TaxID=709868 RepID=A0ABS0JBT2_9ACTN|nr:hypothetical protein [Micromonospora ureilytica]